LGNSWRNCLLNFNSRSHTTSNVRQPTSLNPWFVSGLTDAEGSFCIIISRSSTYRLGWCVQAIFQIALHTRDLTSKGLDQIRQIKAGMNKGRG